MSFRNQLPSWFSHAIEALQSGNTNGWMEMYAPDAVHEFPFAPDGSVRRLDGRAAISSYMSHLPELIHFGTLTDVRVREDGDELIIEATGHHRRVSDNSPIDISYVWFITHHREQVSHIRDYMNPLQLASL